MNPMAVVGWFPDEAGWLIVLAAILLLFGAKRIPDVARSLGRSMSEFKKGRDEGTRDTRDDHRDTDAKPADGKPGK